jgi:hypothetical protein
MLVTLALLIATFTIFISANVNLAACTALTGTKTCETVHTFSFSFSGISIQPLIFTTTAAAAVATATTTSNGRYKRHTGYFLIPSTYIYIYTTMCETHQPRCRNVHFDLERAEII